MKFSNVISVIALFFLTSPDSSAADYSVQKFKFDANPLPKARYFTIQKSGIGVRIAGNPDSKSFSNLMYTAESGFMINASDADAFGFGVSMFSCDNTHFAADVRYRRWFGENLALDIVPHFYAFSTDSLFDFPGIGIAASLSFSERLSFDLSLERFNYTSHVYNPRPINKFKTNTSSQVQLSLGVSGRSYVALTAGGATFLFYLIDAAFSKD